VANFFATLGVLFLDLVMKFLDPPLFREVIFQKQEIRC
jgi:hypothetical protein